MYRDSWFKTFFFCYMPNHRQMTLMSIYSEHNLFINTPKHRE